MIKRLLSSKLMLVFLIVMIWVIGIYVISFWGSKIIPMVGIDATNRFANIDHWYFFDAAFYLDIATNGYKVFHDPQAWGYVYVNTAFFPAFPMIGRVLSYPLKFISFDLRQSLLITNILFSLGASIFIYKTALLLKKDNDYALKTLIYFLVFPFSFFLLAPYSEASLVFFSAGLLYFLVSKKYYYAALMGIGATTARFTGIIFPLIIFLYYLEQNKWNIKKINFRIIFISAIPLLGLMAYMVYQKYAFGDYLYFYKMQQLWRNQFEPDILKTFWRQLNAMQGFDYRRYIEFISITLFALLGFIGLKKINVTFSIFIFLSLLIPLLTGTVDCLNRFVVPIIPAFFVLGLGYKSKVFDFAYMFLAILFLALFTIMFTHSVWVG